MGPSDARDDDRGDSGMAQSAHHEGLLPYLLQKNHRDQPIAVLS